MVPYELIDCEIRPLVRLLNELPGVETEASCVGHEEDEEGYVTFRAESQDAVRAVLSALPTPGHRAAVVANQFQWSAAFVNAVLNAEGELRYTLRFAGHPQYVQRRLLADIERGLKARRAPRPEDAVARRP